MFQSVALMIFLLIPTLTFAGNVAPQFATPNPSRGSDWRWCHTESAPTPGDWCWGAYLYGN
jgi:hypothetical protein